MAQTKLRTGRISGVPMPEPQAPLQWMIDDEMARQADEERRALAASSTHEAPAQLGPIAAPVGRFPTFGPIASKREEAAALSTKSRKGDRQKTRKSTWDKLAETGDILGEAVGWNQWKRLMDRHVYGGEPMFDPMTGRPDEQSVGDSFAAAGAAQLGSMPFERPANSVSMFIGPKAKNFPHRRALDAMDMLQQGIDPETVRTKTGIVFDADGIPRYEIDDSASKLTPKGERFARSNAIDPRSPMMPMEQSFDHPELYSNYPELRNYGTRFADDGGPAGAFYPAWDGKSPQVEAYGQLDAAPTGSYAGSRSQRQVMLHEIQHAVDDIEGTSMGSMPENVPNAVRDQFPGMTDYQRYRRAGGETFANTTGMRANLDMDQRRAISPYYHEPRAAFSAEEIMSLSQDEIRGLIDQDLNRSYQEEFPRSQQWSETPNSSASPEDPRHVRNTIRPAFDPAQPNAPRAPYLREGDTGGYGGAVMGSVDEAATPAPRNGPRRRGSISGMGHNGGPTFTDEELLRQAVETPRKTSARGGYVGAPPGVGTPEAEQELVDAILGRVSGYTGQGEVFYDEAQDTLRNWTTDPEMARRFVSSSGHTSNMMSPLPNTNYAVKGMNQYAVGDEINTGMFSTAASPKVRESFETDTLSADPKTGPYSYNLLPEEYRPADFQNHVNLRGEGRALKGGAVHDTWDKVAFGYPLNPKGQMSAASDTEHLFMDRIYNKVASAVARNPELRARYGTGQKARERIQAALWDIARTEDGLFDVLPFKDILDQTSGFTQMAAMPGPSTGVDPSFLNMPLDFKRQYTDDMFSAFSTADGGNVPAQALGLSPAMREGFGPWNGMMEPNRTIDFAVATNDAGRNKGIDPSSAKAAETMRNWNQFALGQEGSGFTTPRVDGAAKPRDPKATPDLANIASIKGVSVKSPEEFTRAFRAVEQVFGPQWADNVVVQQGRNGELLLKSINEKTNNGEFQSAAREVHNMLGGAGHERMRDVGNDFTYRRFDDPSYRTLMDETRSNPVLKRTFDTKVLPHFSRLQKVSDDWASKMGLPANTVPDRVRRIFIQAGERWPEAMDEAVKKGIIPAIAASAVYQGMYGQFNEGDGGMQ